MTQPQPATLLDELESRQDEVIRRLDELNQQIEQLLGEVVPAQPSVHLRIVHPQASPA